MLENRKFIAYLDEKTVIGSGSALFYISDVDSWNENNRPSKENYNDSVYNAIEKLCKHCRQIDANHFEVYRPIENTLQLKDFLKTIPWIKVIDEDENYVNPNDITSMRDTEKDLLSVVKRAERRLPKKVFVDEIIYSDNTNESNRQFEVEFAFVNYARENNLPETQVYQDFTSENRHIGRIKDFVDKSVQGEKIVYCLAINKDKMAMFAFDNESQIEEIKQGCRTYQKLVSGDDFEDESEEEFESFDFE